MGIYDRIDELTLSMANEAVHAWNWTTGGTKTGLAKLLATVGLVAIPASRFMVFDEYTPSVITSLFFAPLVPLSYAMFNHQEKREAKALEDGMKDLVAERAKDTYKMWGQIDMAGCLFEAGSGISEAYRAERNNHAVGSEIAAAGLGSLGMSFLVMCADNLPPRKNCISRGIDSLKEWYAQTSLQPSL
jgi:hypothetical protein